MSSLDRAKARHTRCALSRSLLLPYLSLRCIEAGSQTNRDLAMLHDQGLSTAQNAALTELVPAMLLWRAYNLIYFFATYLHLFST